MAQAGYALDGFPARVKHPSSDFDHDVARAPLAISVFADRPHVLAEILEDAVGAGLCIYQCGALALLLDDDAVPLGEVVLVDCPEVDAARLAALARLDMRAARSAVQLVVATSVAALDDVFACLDQSGAQILVDPGRAERVVALGRALGRGAERRLRELSEDDRLYLLRLTEQVDGIAQKLDGLRLDRIGLRLPGEGGTLESPAVGFRGGEVGMEERMRRTVHPLPDPRLVRRIIRQRHLRARFFDAELFADPAWDILLDLTAAHAEHKRVSVTSLCIASGVPPTTALRWIGQMSEAGLLERVEDATDRRRAFIALSDRAADGMARYFAELGEIVAELV